MTTTTFAMVPAVVIAAATAGCGGAGTAAGPGTAPEVAPAPPRVAVSLRFVEDIDADPASLPSTRVVLVRIVEDGGRRTFDLGPFPGVCHHEAAPPPLLLRARCGWRGERAGVSLRRLDDAVLVRRVGALGPSFDGPGELTRIPLPEDADLEVVVPPTLPIPGFEPSRTTPPPPRS